MVFNSCCLLELVDNELEPVAAVADPLVADKFALVDDDWGILEPEAWAVRPTDARIWGGIKIKFKEGWIFNSVKKEKRDCKS